MKWTAVDAHAEHLKLTGRSIVTIKAVRHWMELLAHFCETINVHELNAVTAEHINAFEQRLLWQPGPHGQLYKQATVQHVLSMVRLFFRWATRQHMLMVDPTRHLLLRRATQSLRRVLTPAEVETLLAVPDTKTAKGMRDRVILETLYGAGLRLGECAQLDLADVDFDQMTLAITRAKGGLARIQPMGERLAEMLKTYVAENRPRLVGKHKDPLSLFVTKSGKRLEISGIGVMVKQRAQAAGLEFVTPHQLRHAYAIHMIEGGAQLTEVGRLLGHERLQSTRIYTQLCPAEVVKEHKRTHPRAKKKRARKSAKPPAAADTQPPDE